jgi:hypothetical protein
MDSYYTARSAEARMDWPEAVRAWRAIGQHSRAAACEAIIAANERADRFRARVAVLQCQGVGYWDALSQADREIYRTTEGGK